MNHQDLIIKHCKENLKEQQIAFIQYWVFVCPNLRPTMQASEQQYQMIDKLSRVFKTVWQVECYKIKSKGIPSILFGYLGLYLYFFKFTDFMKQIWPEHIEDKVMFQFLVNMSFSIALPLIAFCLYLPGYMGVSFYKKYEVTPSIKKPWQKENWPEMRKKTIYNYFLTYFVVSPLYYYLIMGLSGKASFDFSKQTFPSHGQIIKDFIIIFLADNYFYLVAHRLFHTIPWLYKFHKFHHEYDSVFSLILQHVNPVQGIFANLIPATLVFALYKCHGAMLFIWIIFKLFLASQSHCGYDFPWSPSRVIPLVYNSSYHEFHHTKNIGNYSTSIYFFELFSDSNKLFFDLELKRQLKPYKPE